MNVYISVPVCIYMRVRILVCLCVTVRHVTRVTGEGGGGGGGLGHSRSLAGRTMDVSAGKKNFLLHVFPPLYASRDEASLAHPPDFLILLLSLSHIIEPLCNQNFSK